MLKDQSHSSIQDNKYLATPVAALTSEDSKVQQSLKEVTMIDQSQEILVQVNNSKRRTTQTMKRVHSLE